MTGHLSPEELTAALDRTLARARTNHLAECDTCRAAFENLSELADRIVADGDVPDPSPEFWEQLSERVRVATAIEPLPAAAVAWTRGRGLLTVAGLAAAALLLVVWTWSPAGVDDGSADRVDAATADGDVSWSALDTLASGMSADDVGRVTASTATTTAVLADLTPDERATFVELLQREMGGSE
jgi:hypothetical protein